MHAPTEPGGVVRGPLEEPVTFRGSRSTWVTDGWTRSPPAQRLLIHEFGIRTRKSGSHPTPRWREMDSNPRFPVSGTTLFESAAFSVQPECGACGRRCSML